MKQARERAARRDQIQRDVAEARVVHAEARRRLDEMETAREAALRDAVTQRLAEETAKERLTALEAQRRLGEYTANLDAQIGARKAAFAAALAAEAEARERASERESVRELAIAEARRRLLAMHAAQVCSYLPLHFKRILLTI